MRPTSTLPKHLLATSVVFASLPGPTRKRALLHHFGTLKAIERAAPADLAKVPGISAETARKIYDFFHERAG